MLTDILKQRGLFSKDIKTRLKNGQIKINGMPIDHDVDLSFAGKIEVGEFMEHIVKNRIWLLRVHLFGLENLFDCNIKNDLTEFLKKFTFIRTSKKDAFIIIK